jgi:uncharacterized protein YktB (UPF0637 family)
MAIEPFAPKDFRVFDLPGFADRGTETRAHVAKHARRTANPPEDAWVAFGPDRRSYKKAPHFKIAVSRQAVPFPFALRDFFRLQ